MRSKQGFTIIELIVVMGLTALLGGIVSSVIISSYQSNRKVESASIVQRDINLAMDRVNRVLRSTTDLQQADSTSLRIRGYLNAADAVPSEIYFFIDNATGAIKYDVILPSGAAPNFTYDPAQATTYTLLPKVVNSASDPLFYYYNEIGEQLESPVNLSAVKSVEVIPKSIDTAGTLSEPIVVSTRVTLRNFKTNL